MRFRLKTKCQCICSFSPCPRHFFSCLLSYFGSQIIDNKLVCCEYGKLNSLGGGYYISPCCCLVIKWCLTLSDPVGCSLPGSSVCGISQRRLEWAAISFFKGSSQFRYWTHVSSIGKWILYCGTTREALYFPSALTKHHEESISQQKHLATGFYMHSEF